MERNIDAILSRQNMSRYKTLYVEGNLDYKIISNFLKIKNIDNIRIYKIMADKEKIEEMGYSYIEGLAAKKQIIELINTSNTDSTVQNNKYLGIVDLDYDLCFSSVEDISNLIYTDFNSMESYLIDIDLFKEFASEMEVDNIISFEENINNYYEEFRQFNLMFAVQLKYFSDFSINLIPFDDVPLNDVPFIDKSNSYKILVDNVITFKCNGCKDTWKRVFEAKKDDVLALLNNNNFLIYNHGKHLLRYIIGIYKNLSRKIHTLSDELIINSLKDKFIILSKFNNINMFERIKTFSEL